MSDSDGNNSSSVDFFGATPKVGAIWQITPTAQIYGECQPRLSAAHSPRADRAREPLRQPARAQSDHGVAVRGGHPGTIGPRVTWDFSVYDYEFWDEIQNVNVQPFPFAPSPFRSFRTSAGRGTWASSWEWDVQLVKDIARLTDWARRETSCARGSPIPIRTFAS
jgi:hypothetical protein